MFVRFASLTLSLLLLTGCASMLGTAPVQEMTAKQLHEFAKIKDAAITCINIGTPWGRQSALFLNVDKGVVINGALTVDPDCKATMTNTPKTP